MKKMCRLMMVTILFIGLALPGCGGRNDVERSDAESSLGALNSEEVLGSEEGKYEELRALMGNITYGELLSMLDGSMKKLNTLQTQGATTRDDYLNLYYIFNNMRTMMLEDQATYESSGGAEEARDTAMSEASQALSELVAMMAENHVGQVLNDVIRQTGPNLNVEPMLAYALAADDNIIQNAVGGVTIGTINQTDFNTLMQVANGLVDPDGKYPTLHDDLGNVMDGLKGNEIQNLTIQDAKDLISSLLDALSAEDDDADATTPYPVENKEFVDNLMAALDDLWENDPQFKADLVSLLAESGKLMAVENGGETDMGRVITVAQELLAPAHRDNLRQFVNSAMHGLIATSDGDTLKAIIEKITKTDTDLDGVAETMNTYTGGVGKGLVGTVTHNMYNQPRTSASVKTSGLRALMFMMQEANLGLTLLGIPELSLITSPDGGTVSSITINTAKWTVGEVATAQRWARDYNTKKSASAYAFMADADDNGDGYIDIYEAFDWTLYTKRYRMMGIGVPGLTEYYGLVGTLTNPLVQALMPVGISDPFGAFVELAGGVATSGEGTSVDAFKNREGTAGQRHKLFGLFAPLMEYFWDPNGDGSYSNAEVRVADMVAMLVGMNEIDVDADQNPYITYASATSAYKSMAYLATPSAPMGVEVPGVTARANATFRLDDSGEIMKLIDGGTNYDGGMLYYALRDHDGNAANDGILLDRALDMIVRIVFKLDSETSKLSNGKTTFDGLMEKLDIQGMTDESINDTVTTLFDGEDGEKPLIDSAYELLVDNHDALVGITKPMGQMLVNLAAINARTGDANVISLIDDARTVWPILKDMVSTEDTGEESTLGDYIDYLTAENEDGSDNPLMLNGKKIAYKVLDIQDATYNPGGELTMDTPLTGNDGMVAHLLGGVSWVDTLKEYIGLENGLYDFSPLMDFLVAATGSPDILWAALHDGGDMLDKVMGNVDDPAYTKASLSLSFVRALVKPVDSDKDGKSEGSVLADITNMIQLEGVDFDGVLMDVSDLLAPGNVDLRPGSETFDGLLNILNFVIENSTVR
ncbi:MAG: hypothetical protein ABFD81_09805 [Syntrophaceae bacterium]